MFHLVPAQRARVRFVDDAGTETICPPHTGETEFLANVRNLEKKSDNSTDKDDADIDKDKGDESGSKTTTSGNSITSTSPADEEQQTEHKKRDRAETATGADAWPFQHVAVELRNASQEALQLLQLADLIHKRQTFELDYVPRAPKTTQTKYDEHTVNVKRKRDFLEETLSVLRSGVTRVQQARTRQQEHFDALRHLQRRWGITAPAHGKVLSALRAHEHLAVDCRVPTLQSLLQQQQKKTGNVASTTTGIATTTSTEARIFQRVSHRVVPGNNEKDEVVVESRVAIAVDALCTLQVRILNISEREGEEESSACALPMSLQQSASQLAANLLLSTTDTTDDAGLSNDDLLALQLHSESCRALFLRVCHEVASEGCQATSSGGAAGMVRNETGSSGASSGRTSTTTVSTAPKSRQRSGEGVGDKSSGSSNKLLSSLSFPGLDGASPRSGTTLAQAGATHNVKTMGALTSASASASGQQKQNAGSSRRSSTAKTMTMVRRMCTVQRVRYEVIEELSSRIVVSAGAHRRLEFTLLPVWKVASEHKGGTVARAILLEMEESYRAAVVFGGENSSSGGDILLALVRSAVGIVEHLSACDELVGMWEDVARKRNSSKGNVSRLVFRLRHIAPMHAQLRFEVGKRGGNNNRCAWWDGEIRVVAGVPEVVSFRGNSNGNNTQCQQHAALMHEGDVDVGVVGDGLVNLTIRNILDTLAATNS